jgi:hypothetical protein
MTPGNILNRAVQMGINIMAITDHNSAENVEVILQLAKNKPIHIIPGMEVETKEEVHLLCYFDSLSQVKEWQEIVYDNLPDLKNDEEFFGYQLKTDLKDEFVAKEDRLLATATNLKIGEVVARVKGLGGIVVPSHIDRSYSIIKNLGFVPPELGLDLLEISNKENISSLKKDFPYLKKYNFMQNSDSHYLKDIKAMERLNLENTNLNSIYSKLIVK